MTRPAVPYVAPSGLEWVVVADALEGWHCWTTDPAVVDPRRCRWGNIWHGFCGRPAVAALDRARASLGRAIWYGYCGDHLYGRWIENGAVVGWRLRTTERSR